MPVCLLFLCFSRQKYNHSPCDITLHYSIYRSLLPNVRHMPRGMSYNLRPNIRWGGEHTGLTAQAILRLLIKTRQCCWLIDSNRMFSARCQWRLLRENCWANHTRAQKIMSNFHFLFSTTTMWINFYSYMFVVVSLLSAIFIPADFLISATQTANVKQLYCLSWNWTRHVLSCAVMVIGIDGGFTSSAWHSCVCCRALPQTLQRARFPQIAIIPRSKEVVRFFSENVGVSEYNTQLCTVNKCTVYRSS